MKGIFLKYSRQDPGEARGWPDPSAPTPVSWRQAATTARVKGQSRISHSHCTSVINWKVADVNHVTKPDPTTSAHHHKGVSIPKIIPPRGTARNVNGLTVDGNHVGSGLTYSTPVTQETNIRTDRYKVVLSPLTEVCNFQTRNIKLSFTSSSSTSNTCKYKLLFWFGWIPCVCYRLM